MARVCTFDVALCVRYGCSVEVKLRLPKVDYENDYEQMCEQELARQERTSSITDRPWHEAREGAVLPWHWTDDLGREARRGGALKPWYAWNACSSVSPHRCGTIQPMVHAPVTRRMMKAFAQTAWHGLNVSRASRRRVLSC
jgi:hypothetical protein